MHLSNATTCQIRIMLCALKVAKTNRPYQHFLSTHNLEVVTIVTSQIRAVGQLGHEGVNGQSHGCCAPLSIPLAHSGSIVLIVKYFNSKWKLLVIIMQYHCRFSGNKQFLLQLQ